MLGAVGCCGGALASRPLAGVVVDAGGFVLCPQRGVRAGRAGDSCDEAMRVQAEARKERGRRVGEQMGVGELYAACKQGETCRAGDAVVSGQWSLWSVLASIAPASNVPVRDSRPKPHRSPTSPLNTAAPTAPLHHRAAELYTHRMSGHVDSLSPSFAPFFGMVSAARHTDDFIR